MNYADTTNWMFNQLPMYQLVGATAYKADLHNTIELLNILDNPQDKFRTIHVAGTNGKGTTSHTLASIFQEHGFKTGLYTSPHLHDYRERIRINGTMIPEQNVIDFVAEHKEQMEKMQLSFFEMATGMAFDYFAKEKVDIAIIEVGMGGRLDCTNVIRPEISIITQISMDHTHFLGDTLEKIAAEKAGIIKAGIPVVIGETQPEIEHVFKNKAEEGNSPIFFADQIFDCDKIHIDSLEYQEFDIWKNSELYMEAAKYPLLGYYQKKNLATIICAIDLLKDRFNITKEEIADGLENVVRNTNLMGRWQVMNRCPLVIADTGHNIGGVKEIVAQLNDMNFNKLHFILGCVNDKDIDGILNLLPHYAEYYFCKADIPRGLDANILADKAFKAGLRGNVYESVLNAYKSALNNAKFDDVVFIGGSNFTVAEII
ncbi:MAG: folylpolyglutamate synthase/dihydrofolate synthase family protein [Bacteroidia bacterium]|nr:folylpolyglutamate synthase/dihydrofolate synthase family protein [Bacteroidia bacterium]